MTEDKKSWWTIGWIVWLGLFLLLEIPAAINDTPGDTLSEHVWMWISGNIIHIIVIVLFFFFLTMHFIRKWSVKPVVIFGAGLAYMIVRWWAKTGWNMNFTWSKWLQGLGASALVTGVGVMGPILADGAITKGEWWSLAITILGGVVLYCKNHTPVFEAEVTSQTTTVAVKK